MPEQPEQKGEKLFLQTERSYSQIHEAYVYINMNDGLFTVFTEKYGLERFNNLVHMLTQWEITIA